ncbi:MAG: T9SS type A sorting domain-containing protein [Candidatus Syntrophosphaera sp.]
MKQFCLLFILLLSLSLLGAQTEMPFGDLRHSSRDAGGNIHLRWQDLTGGAVPTQSYYSTDGGDWQEAANTEHSPGIREALVPYEFGQLQRHRLRAEMDYMGQNVAYLHPAFLAEDTFPPATGSMAWIGTDATGDSVTVYSPDLDFTSSWFACSDTKFYAALENVSGSFPTMNSLTSYNAWAATLVNPETAIDSVAYAMIYTFNIPGVIAPGLYKISMDLSGTPYFEQIGSIQSQVIGGKLCLACDISDITGDPQFGDWPSFSKTLVFTGISLMVDIDLVYQDVQFGVGDYSSIGALYFEDNSYECAQNTLPQFSNLSFDYATLGFSFDYYDADSDFPLMMQIQPSSGGLAIEPQPLGHDYSQPVHYQAQLPALPFAGTLVFSDNGIDLIQEELYFVGIEDETLPPARLDCRMPNPLSHSSAPFRLTFSGLGKELLEVDVFNLRGQKLGNIFSAGVQAPEFEFSWNGRIAGKRIAEGLYILRLRQGANVLNRKFSIKN